MKKILKISKKSMLKEHKRLIPELKEAGLYKEAAKQVKELRKIKNK